MSCPARCVPQYFPLDTASYPALCVQRTQRAGKFAVYFLFVSIFGVHRGAVDSLGSLHRTQRAGQLTGFVNYFRIMDTSDVESVESSPIVGKIKRRKKILSSSSSSSSSGDEFQVQKDFVLPTKRRRNKYSGIGVPYDDSCVQASSERKVEDTTDQSYIKRKEEQASSERKVEDTADESFITDEPNYTHIQAVRHNAK